MDSKESDSQEVCGGVDIHLAVAHNDEEQIKAYVSGGGDLDARDRNNLSALHIASAGGFSSVVEFLLRNKAGLGVTSRIGHTPLHLACRFGHLSVVLLLLAEGAEINARDTDGNTPLHKAASNGKAQLCRELMKRGADIDARNKTEYTPLHWACFKGHKAAAEQLLKCGANVDAASSRKATSLFMATYYGHVDVTFLLLAWGADVTRPNEDGIKVGDTFLPEITQQQRNQIKVLLRERLALLMKGYEAARRNTAIMYMRSERSELNLRMTQGEVETLWAKLTEREKQLNMSKMGARDLSHVVKAMKKALEQSRRESKIMQESLTSLQTEVDEAKQEAQEQRGRAARAERSLAELLEGRRSSAAAKEKRLLTSPRFQKELREEEEEEEEGRRGDEGVSPRIGGVVRAFSEAGVPEWKWQRSGQSGRASPESSASSPPSSLHKVPLGGSNSAFINVSDHSNSTSNDNGNGNSTSGKGGIAWRHDRVPFIASGIVSGPSDSAASPVLMSDLPPGRVAERAWRINTRIATDNLGPPSITDVMGPLATALPFPAMTIPSPRGRSSFGGRGCRSDGGRSVLKRSGSSVSLPPPPRDSAGDGFSRNGRGGTSSGSAKAAASGGGDGGGAGGCASSSKKRFLRRSCSSEVRGSLDREDEREDTPRLRSDSRMTTGNTAAVPTGKGQGRGRRGERGGRGEGDEGGREGLRRERGGNEGEGGREGGRRQRGVGGPATPISSSAGASPPRSNGTTSDSNIKSGSSIVMSDKGGFPPTSATVTAASSAAASSAAASSAAASVELEHHQDAGDVGGVHNVQSEKERPTSQHQHQQHQHQQHQRQQQRLVGVEGGDARSTSGIKSDEAMPASPDKGGGAADTSSVSAAAVTSAVESTAVVSDPAGKRFQQERLSR